MAVTGGAHGHAGVAIEKNIAIDVGYPNSFAAFSDELEVRTRIRRIHKLRIGFDDCATFGSRKLSLDFRSDRTSVTQTPSPRSATSLKSGRGYDGFTNCASASTIARPLGPGSSVLISGQIGRPLPKLLRRVQRRA